MMFINSNDVSSDSGAAAAAAGSSSVYAATQGTLAQIKDLTDAFDNFIVSTTKLDTIVDNINKSMTSMNDSAVSLQRSMGGVVFGANDFRERMYQTYMNTIKLGSTFKDVTESIEGLATGMGRIVNPSMETLENMIEISKASGISTKEIGMMVAEMVRFGGTQLDATNKIQSLSIEARKSGLSAKGYTAEIQKNLKTVAGFGFKNGVDGMAKMVKQAMLLRTNIESIGSKTVQNTALDPEGAIQLAANFQMLGGAVGKLADPFQLMYMAQNDVSGLQDELIKSTKAAAVFNKETGKFDVSTEDMYRLRQQAELTGSNLEDLVETGKEAAKMDYLKETFNLGTLTPEEQNIVAGLSEISAGGAVSIDIPGFDEPISKITGKVETLEELMKREDFKTALANYQTIAGKSDRELAEEQMTIQDKQARDVNEIKEYIMRNMTKTERDNLLTSIKNANDNLGETYKSVANTSSKEQGKLITTLNEGVAEGAKKFEVTEDALRAMENKMGTRTAEEKEGRKIDEEPAEDLFVGKSSAAPKVMAAGQLYKGIVGDEVAMGTNLTEAFNSKQNVLGGKLDININVGGSVGGDSGTVAKMFEDPAVQKKIMDTVLYKLEMYKKQKGVLA